MSHVHRHVGNDWTNCTLCRSERLGVNTLMRAAQRKVDWPEPKQLTGAPLEDPTSFTSIDDAFATILQCLSTSSRQCKRYYRGCSSKSCDGKDKAHCNRFHTPAYAKIQHTNPLQMAEDVHVVVHPGTYSVTAGEWGTTRQQTHVVNIRPGETVNLDFVM